jgi:hypothetical protein
VLEHLRFGLNKRFEDFIFLGNFALLAPLYHRAVEMTKCTIVLRFPDRRIPSFIERQKC